MVSVFFNDKSYREDGKLENIADGALFESHPVLSVNRRAIQIVLYSDEIELCYAIGNHVKKHKLLMFYYVLHNLPKKYRSRLPAIHLYAVVKKEHVETYGYNKVLEPLVAELNELAEGCQMELLDGSLCDVQGSLLAYVADTPAAHEAGGFKEGVGRAFRKCWH